jgi:molybdopterin biosynthesis enzyme
LLSFESDQDDKSRTRDSNGPYIQATLRELGVDATYFGIIRDDRRTFEDTVRSTLAESEYDAVITTGAVSMGKFDFVRSGLAGLGADVRFPRWPSDRGILFSLPWYRRSEKASLTTMIHLQHSPVRRQCTQEEDTRFLSLAYLEIHWQRSSVSFPGYSYLRFLHGQAAERPTPVRLNTNETLFADQWVEDYCKVTPETRATTCVLAWQGQVHAFRVGIRSPSDQGSSKIKTLLNANGWVVAHEGVGR